MVAKQTEIKIYKKVDKNTEDKNTKNTHVTRWTLKTCDLQYYVFIVLIKPVKS